MNNQQTTPTAPARFIIDPETLVMYDRETGSRFAYVTVSGKEVRGE